MSHQHAAPPRPHRVWQRPKGTVQWVATLVFGVVWMMVWGRYDLPTLLMGLVLGIVVALVFPLPPLKFTGTLRPHWWLVLSLSILIDLVKASLQVTWLTVTKGPRIRNAIIAVELRTLSDFILAQTVELTTLVPGSVVLETRRHPDGQPPTIYVHVMDAEDPATVEAARASVRKLEARIIRAFGTADELAQLRAEQGERRDEPEGGEPR